MKSEFRNTDPEFRNSEIKSPLTISFFNFFLYIRFIAKIETHKNKVNMKKLRLNKIKVAKLSNQELVKVKGGESEGECSGICNSDNKADPFCATGTGSGPIDIFVYRIA